MIEYKYCFITLRIYKVLKQALGLLLISSSFITLRIYKVLKRLMAQKHLSPVLSH